MHPASEEVCSTIPGRRRGVQSIALGVLVKAVGAKSREAWGRGFGTHGARLGKRRHHFAHPQKYSRPKQDTFQDLRFRIAWAGDHCVGGH